MVSRVLSSLVCVLWVILLPAVWADYCDSYIDANGRNHPAGACRVGFCCGTCVNRGCCSDRKLQITLEKQRRCSGSTTSNDKKSRLGTLLGSILGSIFPIILCVGLIICCVAPCCLFYKKCRKGGNRGSQTPGSNPTTVINVPHQPHPPASGYQPAYPGYQPVPAQPGYGGLPMPTAPPSYNNPANPAPGVYPAGLPMVPYPGQPHAPPYHPDAPPYLPDAPPYLPDAPPYHPGAPMPYNHSYAPNR